MERCGFLTKFLVRFTNTQGVWTVVSKINPYNNYPDFQLNPDHILIWENHIGSFLVNLIS